MSRVRTIHYAVFTLVVSYVMTTGIGAAIFPFQFGREQAAAISEMSTISLDKLHTLGSLLYWCLLLSFVIVVPAAAFVAERLTRQVAPSIRIPEIPTWIPILVAAAMSAFCVYKLAMAGALTVGEIWDRSICFEGKMVRRYQLFDLLGNRYYSFAFSSLPVIACYLLARWMKQRDMLALAGSVVLSALIIWFDIAMIMKAPVIIFVGMLALTLVVSGFGLIKTFIAAAPVCIGLYLGLVALQMCSAEPLLWESTRAAAPVVVSSQTAMPPQTVIPPQPPGPTNRVSEPAATVVPVAIDQKSAALEKLARILRATFFRMAIGFPYYVDVFSDPDQRCGIERPPLKLLPAQACFVPIKVFSKIYRQTAVQGFQPGPVNTSAYGEAGPAYVLAATIACGLILGFIAAFARSADALSVAITVASCVYAYYASQVSLTSLLIDSYGLVWLALPLVLMIGMAALWATFRAPSSSPTMAGR
jgi:hypothetical protein